LTHPHLAGIWARRSRWCGHWLVVLGPTCTDAHTYSR
jgi:hypothetical protein